MSDALRLARFRFERSWRRSRTGALAIVILMGGAGGAALASLVAARDTSSSYTTFLARSNPSDFSLLIPANVAASRFESLPGVTRVTTSFEGLAVFPISRTGKVLFPPAYNTGVVIPVGASGGEFFSVDRVAVVAGHRANPGDPREFMATADAERLLGWHLGETVRFGVFSYPETNEPGFGTAKVKPIHDYLERLVATIVFNDEVVRDAIDRYPAKFLFTPAALRGSLAGISYVTYHFKVRGGYAGVARVEREVIQALPRGNPYNFHNYSGVAAKANLTVRPEALALLVFGILALVGTALTAVQLVARRLREGRDDAEVLRALGARPRAVAIDTLAVPMLAVVLGALLAVVVATALSPLSVIGPVRPVLPHSVHLDWVIVVGGAAAIGVVTAIVGWLLAQRLAPGRVGADILVPRSRVAHASRSAGLPVPLGMGLAFAFEPGRGRTAVPVRSVLVGVVAAVALIAATLTFGGGFSTLVSHPALYGWNFDVAFSGSSDVPPPAVKAISQSPLVESWASASFGDATIDGIVVPVLLEPHGSTWQPALIAGHEVEGTRQIVLGAQTMAALHAHLGGTVLAGYGAKRDYPIYIAPRRLRIVGVATLPAVGESNILHTSMGTGAVLDQAIEPPAMVRAIQTPFATLNGPPLVVVRYRAGTTRAERLAFEHRVDAIGDAAFKAVPNGNASGDAMAAIGVQYPAQIISYRSSEAIPVILALAFSGGIIVAFALTVAASARRRRRDLALLKSLGMRRRQLAGTVAAQATVSVVVGLVVGVPVGVVAGRWLWGLFAQTIYAVPRATVPWAGLGWLVLGALALANLVAYPPGRAAARAPVAELLRAE